MEKKKFEMKLPDMNEAVELEIGGEKVRVLRHIPLEQKMQMASEYVQMVTVEDEELGIVTDSSLRDVCEIYLIVKYYTDVDLKGADVQRVADWIMCNNADYEIQDVIENDYDYVCKMYQRLYENVNDEYRMRNSLQHAIKTSFGFLFSGKDITEMLAEARDVNEQMIDVVGRLNESAKKDEAGRVKVSGNVINIGKRQK